MTASRIARFLAFALILFYLAPLVALLVIL